MSGISGFEVSETEPTGSSSPGPVSFDMAADDDENEVSSSASGSPGGSFCNTGSLPSGTAAVAAVEGPDGIQIGNEVRERFRWIKPHEQKTVCKLECERALSKQDALLKQLQLTVERYKTALEVANAVENSATRDPDQEEALEDVGISPELASKYEDRIDFLNSIAAALTAEPPVSLPRLTPLEQAKGVAFQSWSWGASSANKLKDSPAVANAGAAFANFASRFKRGGSNAGNPENSVAAASTPF
eukprot:TRINITY_DN27031_c1_g1_i1.p1 TRINITY_DN27031_c1_g1~~TRINITY_DN27031_c1_g1_i1.p1  ORF type:complete len:258 (+),score=68.66 TRINITY_DN27031_c1_g1_i1:42-776(+)